MANRNGSHHPLPPRPPLPTHQSNSVPSTPHQHAREFRSHSRSPSPHSGLELGSHSPRSVKSESNGPMATLPKGRPTCKYETSAAFSRRRMQYDIGDAPLEKPKEIPKKTLDPDEEKKLSGDMREVYDRLLPSKESDKRRTQFVEKLDKILRKQWPETEFKVHIFGSSGNLLCTSESDVDVCIQTPMKKLETMHMLAEVLANNGMERVVCIAAAKVPIVKLWDPELRLAADMNVNNTLAIENTRMIKTYVQIDKRVRPLAMIVKHWTKQRILNDAGIGGTLSSYTWICMVLNFLQTRNPPILPVLHQLPHKEYKAQDGTESGFNDDLEKLRNCGAANTETVGELLFQFFRFYAHDMDYESSVISVRHGKLLSREEKGWDISSKEGQWRLCVEEPFNTTRNLGNSADSTAFRGIHLELRQAFGHLANGVKLDDMLQEYRYPPEEKNIFKKPVSGPKPILSSAILPQPPSNRGRGGGSMRGSRFSGPRSGNGARRSSSGASFSRQPFSPFSPPLGMIGSDYMGVGVGSPDAMARLQEQLLQQTINNGFQLEQLKARFVFQDQQLRAAEQARNAAALHAQATARGSNGTSQATSATVSPQKTPYMTGRSSPQLSHNAMMYPEYLYQGLPYEGQPLSQSVSHDGSRTNPSSPSLVNAVPRRSVRPSGLSRESEGSASIRSQSQPARGLPHGFTPGFSPFAAIPGYGVPSYAVSSASQDVSSMSQSSGDASAPFDNNLFRTSSMPVHDATPKEYVGYYMPDPRAAQSLPTTAPAQPHLPIFGTLPRIPQYSELAHRRNRQSQDLQLTLNGTRRISRSPSPLGHHRTYSIPVHGNHAAVRSAPLLKMVDSRVDRADSAQASHEHSVALTGPAVVNGSSLPMPRTPEMRSTASDEELSIASGGDTSTVFFSKPNLYGREDALGLSGLQHPYESEHSRQRYSSVGYPSSGPNGHYPEYTSAAQETLSPTYSPPSQPFPSFVDSQMPPSGPSMISPDDHIISPKTMQSPWSAAAASKPTMAPIDTAKAAQTSRNPGEPKTAPVLSPVYETRTPSPTAKRTDHFRQTSLNGALKREHVISNGVSVAVNGSKAPTEPVPPTPGGRINPAGSSMNGTTSEKDKQAAEGSNGNGQWQQAGAPKKKYRQRTKSVGHPSTGTGMQTGNEGRARTQQMPTNKGERKGG